MFTRRTLLYGVAALALFALAVTAGKGGGGKPPKDPPADADPAILYVKRGHYPDYPLWVMDADGGNKTELLSPANFAIAAADWSPDNAQIVVLRRRADNANLWTYAIADADGSNMTAIQPGTGDTYWLGSTPGDPQWRTFPNGEERIVFHPYDSSGGLTDSWTMKTDGTDKRPLLAVANRNDTCRISRDGTLAAIEYNFPSEYRHVELGTVAIDDDDDPVVESIVPLSEFTGSPLKGGDVWSPAIDRSGTLVAVSAGQMGDPGLWIIPIASPADAWRVPVPTDDGWVPESASWLDARTLVYQRYNGKRHEIFTADIYDGQEEKIASHKRDSLMAPRAKN